MRVRLFLILLGSLLLMPGYARAQLPFWALPQKETKPADSEPKIPLPQEIAEKKSQNLEALKVLRQAVPDPELNSMPARLQDLRDQLDAAYEQLLETLEDQQNLSQAKASLEDSREKWRSHKNGNDKASFFQLDDLTTERMLQKSRLDNIGKSIDANQILLEEAKGAFEEDEKNRRQKKESFGLNKDVSLADSLRENLELAEIQSQLAAAKILFLQNEIKALRDERDFVELQVAFLDEKIRFLGSNVKFTPDDLQDKLKSLKEEETRLGQAIAALRRQLATLQKAPAATSAAAPEATANPYLGAVKGLEKKHLQDQIKILTVRLGRLKDSEELWRRRYRSFNEKVPGSELKQWLEQNQEGLAQIRRTELSIYAQLSELRKELNKVKEKLADLDPADTENKSLLYAQKDLLEKILNADQEALSGGLRDRQLLEKFQSEIKPKVEGRSFGERAAEIWTQALRVWNFELTSIDDKPITVKKLVLVLVLLLVGVRFSRRLSSLLGNKVFPRLGMESGVAAGLTTLTFYVLLLLVSMFILYIVNVPLTMFTVLGGALAIGVGFGSQNMLKNFISGIILLMERPLKVGDLVQIDDVSGIIERIGARSTVMRSFTNVQIIVPNSEFLEKKLTNWTLSDDLVRTSVSIGVSYSSRIEEVMKLLTQAVKDHPKVLPAPEAVVLFSDFGDSSLKFEIHFWIRMRTTLDRRRVESDIRFRIDEIFKEAGVVIVSPQKDIRLDSLRPLLVRMVDGEPPPP